MHMIGTQGGAPVAEISPQRRGRRIAMTPVERDAFLAAHRTCRVATVGPRGPHVAPMWFFWDGAHLWLNSVVSSQRWTDIARDPRIAVVMDDGEEYGQLRGIEIAGEAVSVGEVPRVGDPVAELDHVESGFHAKYRDPCLPIVHDGRHAWLKVTPSKITSWDFRKITMTERQSA